MTFQEKFDELKAKYGKIDESKLTEPFAIQVNMTDDESCGTFYVAYMNDVFAIEPYDYRDHTAMITVPVSDLEAILACKADAVPLFLTGVLKVDGNLDHAMMLVKLMSKKEKKAPCKRAPAKKAEKKEEPVACEQAATASVKEEKTAAAKTEAPKKKTAKKASK